MLDIKITRTETPKEKPAKGQKLGFGKIFVDSTLIDAKVERTDVEVFYVPATQLAKDAGFSTLANMVLVGKVLHECDAVSFQNNRETFEKFIPAKKAGLIDMNCQALQTGYDF